MYRSDLSASNPRPKVPKLAGSAKSSPDKPPGLLHPVFTLLRKSLPASHLLSHSCGNRVEKQEIDRVKCSLGSVKAPIEVSDIFHSPSSMPLQVC